MTNSPWTRTETARFLLLSAGSLSGENVVDVLEPRRASVRLIATNSTEQAHNLYRCDAVYLVPETKSAPLELAGCLDRIIAAEQPHLIIPCRDDDVAFLAEYAASRPNVAGITVVGSPASAQAICDKWRSFTFSHESGLPFAHSALASDEEGVRALAERHGYPLIAKPRHGFASRGVRIVWSAEQLSRHLGNPDMLLQQYLGSLQTLENWRRDMEQLGVPLFSTFEEPKYSLQAFIGPDGRILAQIATRHMMRQGRSVEVENLINPELSGLGSSIAKAFSQLVWRGPLNAQCQLAPDGRYYIYEFNGRFTGATGARALFGYDEVGLAAASFGDVDLPSLDGDDSAQMVFRAQRSVRIPAASASTLRETGFWEKPC